MISGYLRNYWLIRIKQLLVTIFTILLVTTCGGDEDKLTVRTVPLANFEDKGIIERNIETLETTNSEIIRTRVYHVFSNDEQNRVFNTIAISDLYKLESAEPTLFANVKEGVIVWQRNNHAVTEFEDKVSSARTIISFNEENKFDLLIIGSAVNNLPNGELFYDGSNLLAVQDDNKEYYLGEFLIQVDFARGTGIITQANTNQSDTAIQYSNLNGNFIVNTGTGTFNGNELDLIINPMGDALAREELKATIYGSFHGNGAVGITGLYYDNANSPEYIGAIVGTRQDMR